MDTVNRRNFLKGSLAAAAATASGTMISPAPVAAGPAFDPGSVFNPGEIIDTNVYLFPWAFSRSKYDDTRTLVDKLRRHGVIQAWAGSCEGIFHKDVEGVNARLVEECARHGDGLLLPFGTVNPRLRGWQRDLRRCAEVYHMRGIRLHPGYQDYALEDPAFTDLLQMAADHHLLVQVVCWMEDERHHHTRMIVPTVQPAPIPDMVDNIPGLQVMMLNTFRNPGAPVFDRLIRTDRISIDIGMLELIAGLGVFLEQVPLDRVVFGSYMPYFYIEANLLKFPESNITGNRAKAIYADNARRILANA